MTHHVKYYKDKVGLDIKMEKRGQVRCADAQEVFLALTSTDPAIGVLQPKARTTQSQ